MNWRDITYLRDGSDRQKQAYDTLVRLHVLERLAPFDPVLIGTIPIQIDIESSDIDIACEVHDFERFEHVVRQAYASFESFSYRQRVVEGMKRGVANFHALGFDIELFGQPLPVDKQNGYRHMLIEHRLLTLAGERAREEIIALKKQGYKTEPAFCHFFGLHAPDPYQKLLELETETDDSLKLMLRT